ncbi:aminopeptidase N isoform X2 [Folsomia candida]|nr:aminopeptidase N isoform X2 [Folsomia candida]XP_035714677.1 aminopeptidase N isoform X2 [Folsomia candida]
MAQSREQLTMDNTKDNNSMFKRPRGCYLSQAKAFGLVLLAVGAVVAAVLLTYHWTTCEDGGPLSQKSGGGKGLAKADKLYVRLPTNVKPLYYKVDLIPYVEEAKNFTIDGKVWIDIECLQATHKVTIHIKNITVVEESVKIYEVDEAELSPSVTEAVESVSPKKHEYDVPREFYNMTLPKSLEAGKVYRIYIQFRALLADSLGGFYRSSYKDMAANVTRYLGTTQFQATDARKAFPCFDEPQLKARFEISLARRVNMSSISNMNLNRTEPVEGMEGWLWDHYNISVPMSTYLVAFVVSDFENRVANRSLSKPEFRVWARKEAIEQAEYARDIGPRILTFYETYFDIEFPLPKQDMIALPDFGAGAMENWGLITYRETAMLYDPKVSSDLSKLRVATVIAHELAHMWYGNLVTMAWWSDLWLNEGFASYVEYIGVNHVHPDWKILEQFVADEMQYVFSLDALDSSHPIYIPVGHPEEISEIFDGISYAKGASIIRMMNHFLTEDTFRTGLASYLKKWKFNNTVQDDLWESLTEAAHHQTSLDPAITVKEIMDTWTLQKGFPVVHVERNYDANEPTATFTQTKFQLIKNETLTQGEYSTYKWWIPISYASINFNANFNRTKPSFWIKASDKAVTKPIDTNKQDWIIVNVQETGFYRVNYDLKNWGLLINQLRSNASVIHPINRGQLMDDALNLARASLLPYDLAFNVTQYLKNEEEYLPWESFFNAFHFISTMMSKSSSYGTFKKYMRDLVHKEYTRLGYEQNESDSLLQRLHRTNVVSWACKVDHKGCLESTTTLFSEWMNSSSPNTENPIPTNLKKVTYCTAIKMGGEKEWNFLWQRYLDGNVGSEKSTILTSLSCSRETWILNRYLTWSITENSGIRKQDTSIVLRSMAATSVGNYLTFNFVRDKWAKLKEFLGDGLSSLGPIVKSIAARLNTRFELNEMQQLRDRYQGELGAATRAVDQGIETATIQIQWMEENYPTIASWLEKAIQVGGESTTTGNSEL